VQDDPTARDDERCEKRGVWWCAGEERICSRVRGRRDPEVNWGVYREHETNRGTLRRRGARWIKRRAASEFSCGILFDFQTMSQNCFRGGCVLLPTLITPRP
jgi:hypothetical protein